MSGAERCDEILRLIDEALETVDPAAGSTDDTEQPRDALTPRACDALGRGALVLAPWMIAVG